MASGNTKNFELKLGKTGLVIVIAGFTALLCGSFLFGVEIGKNIDTYPENIALLPQKLLALVWRPAKIKVAQTTEENKMVQTQPKAQEEPNLTFFNALTGKKGAVKEQPIPDKKPVAEVPTVQQLVPQPQNKTAAPVNPVTEIKKPLAVNTTNGDKQEVKKKDEKSTVATKTTGDAIEAKIKAAESVKAGSEIKKPLAVNATTTDKKEIKRKEEKLAAATKATEDAIEAKIKKAESVKAVKGEKFAVQVASLKEKAKADELRKKLSASGFKSRIAENNIPGKGKWFRVVVEGFSSKESAHAASEKILKKTGISSGIVKRVETPIKSN